MRYKNKLWKNLNCASIDAGEEAVEGKAVESDNRMK